MQYITQHEYNVSRDNYEDNTEVTSLTRGGGFLGLSSSSLSSSLLITMLWMEAMSVFLPLFAVVVPRALPLPLGAGLFRPVCWKLSSGSLKRIKAVHQIICQSQSDYYYQKFHENALVRHKYK